MTTPTSAEGSEKNLSAHTPQLYEPQAEVYAHLPTGYTPLPPGAAGQPPIYGPPGVTPHPFPAAHGAPQNTTVLHPPSHVVPTVITPSVIYSGPRWHTNRHVVFVLFLSMMSVGATWTLALIVSLRAWASNGLYELFSRPMLGLYVSCFGWFVLFPLLKQVYYQQEASSPTRRGILTVAVLLVNWTMPIPFYINDKRFGTAHMASQLLPTLVHILLAVALLVPSLQPVFFPFYLQ